MPSKNFLSLINNKVKAWLNFEFENLKDQKNIIYDAAEESFGKEGIPLFEELLLNEKFKHYLRTRKRISPQRLEAQLLRLFNRATMEIPLSTIALIAYNMASDEYIESEKYFFKRKDSHSSLLLYESNFCKILEQNQNLINLFFEMVKSDHLHFLTEKYENQIQVYLFDKLTDLLMGVKSVELIEDCVRKLLSPVMSRFIQTSIDEDCWKSFLGDFIKLYYISKSMASNYILGAEIINGRYKYKKKTDMLEAIVLARLVELKEILVLLENDSKLRDFQKFIDKYGELFDDFQQFVWTTVLSCPEEKILPVMEILSSEPFSRLESFYTKDLSVLKFLIKSIITSMLDIKMKSFTPTSYKVILKLFLKLDVDVGLLRRRAFIFHILKRYTNSILIELEIIRYLFFEYIFIALKVVPDRGRVINRFCDEGHRTFCLWADETYREGLNLHPRERVEFYKPLFDYLRAIVWKDHFNKFEKYNYQLIRIQSTAISLETEDYVFNELEKVDSEDFPFYHDCFFDVFYSRPEDIGLAIQSDYWYRLPLAMARPHIQSLILTIVGTVTIKEGSLGAYTNGSFIALPKYVNYFKDRIEPLEKNRNLTIYMALAIHEAGHILAGTFRFNFQYYLKTLENPELFKTILNMFEDYRIESFIIKMKVHSQVEELINSMNHYFSLKNWREGQDTVFAFLTACVDFAFGYDSILNSWGGYELEIQKLYECNYNSGRFKNIKVFIEYIVDRLKNMKLGNPISAYMISREVYEILKLWPPECFDYQKGISTGNHECEFFESENNSSHSVLSDEELKNLYNSYNSDPYAFVNQFNLPNVPTVHGGNENDKIESSQIEKQNNEIINFEADSYLEMPGTLDFSHRTLADDVSAEAMLDSNREIIRERIRKAKKKNKKIVYSIDPKTKSRTKLSEIKEYTLTNFNSEFYKKLKRWEFLRFKILEELSSLNLHNMETDETSAEDGEINMELLLEILSQRNKVGVHEFLDIYVPKNKNLDVVIGLDASGSTASEVSDDLTVLELEKTFAILFGEALESFSGNVSYFAFDSMTSTNIYRANTIRNVTSIEPGNANRDGDFIRYVSSYLKNTRSDLKYFFFLSDGQPSADNYFGKEALDDTLIALREAKNSGIRVIYFNIDSYKGEYFDIFSKETTYARHFSNPMDLIPIIPELIRSMANAIT